MDNGRQKRHRFEYEMRLVADRPGRRWTPITLRQLESPRIQNRIRNLLDLD